MDQLIDTARVGAHTQQPRHFGMRENENGEKESNWALF